MIDQVQIKNKESYVKKGLMVGEFHQHSNVGGVRNEDLMVLRSYHPMLVARHLVTQDLVFLTPSMYDNKYKIGLLEC